MRFFVLVALSVLCACSVARPPANVEIASADDGIVPLTLEQDREISGVRPGS